MKRRASSVVLLVAACIPLLTVVAVGLLHSLFEGAEDGIAATVRTLIILSPSLALGALYARRWMGKGETRLPRATLAAALIQLVALAVAMGGFVDSRASAYWAAVRSDTRSLASQQEIFWSNEGHYSSDVDSLYFTTSVDVEVELRSSGDGWSARVTHPLLGTEYACAVWQGAVEPFPASAGRIPPEPGRPLCYQSHRLSGLGGVGDMLFAVHQRADLIFKLGGY